MKTQIHQETLRNSETRDSILAFTREYVCNNELTPPLSMEELDWHASTVIDLHRIDPAFKNFIMVLINNEVWRDTLASIPFERRLLLLPKCLRSFEDCPAEIDEIGLICEECGRCAIGGLQNMAEELGYVVLIAEGSTVVTKLLEGGKVDAVIGVSCLSALEKSFPHMAAEAIPGIAVPLLYDGCENTKVDTSWIEDTINLKSDQRWLGKVDFNNYRDEVSQWFEKDNLTPFIQTSESETENIALRWLMKSGKRWRPLLAACVHKIVTEDNNDNSNSLRRLAIAVECFHKASLVHDDIEDNSRFRYGDITLHETHGTPIAINIGDLLLGWGYKLISECQCSNSQKSKILTVAAKGHHDLCLGQGEELAWMQANSSLSVDNVINTFKLKTAPAFNVALQFGAIAGDADDSVCSILEEFSNSLGIAYQIKDDMADFMSQDTNPDNSSVTPSLLIALACEHASGSDRKIITSFLSDSNQGMDELRLLVEKMKLHDKAQQLLSHYKNEAIRSLIPLKNAHLKTLLRRIVSKILGNL